MFCMLYALHAGHTDVVYNLQTSDTEPYRRKVAICNHFLLATVLSLGVLYYNSFYLLVLAPAVMF